MTASGGKATIAPGKVRIEIDRLLKEFLREGVVFASSFAEMPQAALVGAPGVEAPRRLAHGAMLLGIGDSRGDGDRHRPGDLVLHREDVGEIAVVALGPDVVAGLGLD